MSTFTDTELRALTASLSPAQKANFDAQFNAVKKNRGTALLLAIIPLTGGLGFGRFYLGQTGLGILHIALWVLFFVPGIAYWIIDIFLIGKACDNWNREKAREIAAQVRTIGERAHVS